MNLNLFKSKTMKVDFPYEVKRTNRKKSATIKVVEGKVEVVIPKTLSKKELQQLVYKKRLWIARKLDEQSRLTPRKEKECVSGESFPYLGKNYRLKLVDEDSAVVKLKGGRLVLGINKAPSSQERAAFVRQALEAWYIVHAEERLRDKTARYAKLMGVEPASINVRDYKSRWGGCSIEGVISYNWRIIMAPHHIVDYVVVHELAHLIHHNHSSSYWKEVERVIPEYKKCRAWLKRDGSGMVL